MKNFKKSFNINPQKIFYFDYNRTENDHFPYFVYGRRANYFTELSPDDYYDKKIIMLSVYNLHK